MKRRDFIKDSAVSGLAIATSSPSFDDVLGRTKPSSASAQSGSETAFWPDGARLVISISMQMEAGAQPLSGAESPMPKLDPLYPDLPTAKWYEYGFKAFWLRGTPHTLEILEELGFIYHIDDVSRDEPFLIKVKGKPFAVVPYTLHMNDIVDYESRYFSTQEYAGDLKAEFDMLYSESSKRRRMMSVSAHDRIAGRPSRTKVLEEFIDYAQNHTGVVFMRKDEIARFALSSPQTIREGF